MAIRKAVVKLFGASLLPEDTYQNTFHFQKDAGAFGVTETLEIDSALSQFFNGVKPPGTAQIATFISNQVSRLEGVILQYDLQPGAPGEGDDVQGSPVSATPLIISAAGSATSLPLETALCLSYGAARDSVPEETPQPPAGPAGDLRLRARRRGRVFIGPFNNNAIVAATGRPTAGLINALVGAGDFLENPSTFPSGIYWAVYSRVDGVARAVTDGWVDDAFDTVRNRGYAPTARTTFT